MSFSNSARWTDPRLQTRSRMVRTCNSKHPHPSHGAALAHLRSLSKNELRWGRPVDPGLQPYRCPICGGWHLGRLKSDAAPAGDRQGTFRHM